MKSSRNYRLLCVLSSLLKEGYKEEEIVSALKMLSDKSLSIRFSKFENLVINMSEGDLKLLEKVREILSDKMSEEDTFRKRKLVSIEYVILKLVLDFLEKERKNQSQESN